MTIDDLRKNVEKQFMISQVQREEVGSKLTITEEEARQYYASHTQEFTEPANVTLREILVESPAATQKGQAGDQRRRRTTRRARGRRRSASASWPAKTSPRSPPRSRARRRSRPAV